MMPVTVDPFEMTLLAYDSRTVVKGYSWARGVFTSM